MELIGKNILVTSNEEWGDVWYSKHNYAYELSKQNNVLFIDPPSRWEPANIVGTRIDVRTITNSLRVLRYTNVIPALTGATYAFNNTLVSKAIHRYLHREGWSVDLFISFDPSRLYDPSLLKVGTSLFIAVDDYDLTMRGERSLYMNVDRIVTISEQFNRTFAPFNKPILTIGHGISSEEFSAPALDLPFSGFGLYIGTIDTRVELGTIRRMVEQHPEVPFVFIGRFTLHGVPEAEELFISGSFKNLHYLGVKPFKELKSYIAASLFCLAPMDVSRPGNDISHHKIFQYLALGKPVFSTEFKEYRPIADLLYMRNDRSELLLALTDFLRSGETGDLQERRITFARSRTYGSIFQKIGSFLQGD